MATSAFFRRLLGLMRRHPRATGGLLLLGTAWVAACLALGYRLPWFDRHPSWGAFPALTNPRLAVQEIPDSVFAPRYGHRFPYPEEADSTGRTIEFFDKYAANLRNIHSIGYQRTSNRFHLNVTFLHWSGPADLGVRTPPWPTGFRSFGYEYLALTLGDEIEKFKSYSILDASTELDDFYQYNYPVHQQDTLYLRYRRTNYRVFIH